MKKTKETRKLTKGILVSLGIPAVFIPGLILASILGWNWQKDLARVAERGGFYQTLRLFPKEAVVDEVVDGDTLELENGRTIRMVGIDAPNRGEELYGRALEETIKLTEGKKVVLEYDEYQDDKFGRILAYVWIECQEEKGCQEGKLMLNKALVDEGLAKVVIYEKRKKLRYQEELIKAEEEAKRANLGIWR